jgi:hypothetical protein
MVERIRRRLIEWLEPELQNGEIAVIVRRRECRGVYRAEFYPQNLSIDSTYCGNGVTRTRIEMHFE